MNFVNQLSQQRKQLEDELRKMEDMRIVLEKQLLLLKSGFKDVNLTAGATKRKQVASAKPSSRSPKVQLPDSDAMWKTCERIVAEVKAYNKEMAVWFMTPVKKEIVPDYYNIIKHPICFEDIDKKLKDKKYQSPLDFRDDMRLLWDNCRTYNRIGTAVRCGGDTLSEQFERKWATSLIEESLAVKDAQEFIAEVNQMMPADPQQRLEAMQEMSKKLNEAQAKIDRYYADDTFMSFEDKRKLSISLGNLPGDLLSRALEIVFDCMRRQGRPVPADGEVEVDIDELDKPALQQLQKLCNDAEKKNRKSHGSAPAKTTQPVPGQGAPAFGYGLPAGTNAPHHASQNYIHQQAAAAVASGQPLPAAYTAQQANEPLGPVPSEAMNQAHPGHGINLGAQNQQAAAAVAAAANANAANGHGAGEGQQHAQGLEAGHAAHPHAHAHAPPPQQHGAPAGTHGEAAPGSMPPPPLPVDAARGVNVNGGGAMEREASEESSSGSDSEEEPEGKGTMLGYGGHAPVTQVSGNVRGVQPQIVKPVSSKKEPTVNTENWAAELNNADAADPFSSYEPPQN